jgi:predicted nucleotide-binding protein (sugar kinase/HSP70/actin superfamily)
MRRPFQILLIEQIFYPLTWIIGLSLLVNIAPEIIVKNTELEPKKTGTYLALIFIFMIQLILSTWIPYTCYRVIKSTKQHYTGFKNTAWQCYGYGIGLITTIQTIYFLLTAI